MSYLFKRACIVFGTGLLNATAKQAYFPPNTMLGVQRFKMMLNRFNLIKFYKSYVLPLHLLFAVLKGPSAASAGPR